MSVSPKDVSLFVCHAEFLDYFGLPHSDWFRRRFHHSTAALTCSQFFRSIELRKDALKLCRDVRQLEVFFVEFVIAALAKPEQAIEFVVATLAFDDQTDRIRTADRIVRHPRRKQKHLAFTNRNFDGLAVFLDLNLYVAF